MAFKMGLLGRKLGMTQVFHEDGTALGCTVLALGPCVVTAQRSPDKNGYAAIQLGFEAVPQRLASKSALGYSKKVGIDQAPRVFKEVRLEAGDVGKYEIGKVLKAADVFKVGDVVDAVGVTKGKGYQGVIKRHKMAGFRATHGTHEFFRHGGSIGCRLTPGRTHRGKRMTGHMGDRNYTASDLVVVKVLEDKDVVLVKGAVPGARNGLVLLKGSTKNVKKYVVPRPVKEIESKNPMKASKKGAGK
ncbi:MAG TPA: 50S ribosomal protein L3 [Polyangia bacterium]